MAVRNAGSPNESIGGWPSWDRWGPLGGGVAARGGLTASRHARRQVVSVRGCAASCPGTPSKSTGVAARSLGRLGGLPGGGHSSDSDFDRGWAVRDGQGEDCGGAIAASELTRTPDPRRDSKMPSATSWSYAATTLPRETPTAAASFRLAGMASPGRSKPLARSSRTVRTICSGMLTPLVRLMTSVSAGEVFTSSV